MAANKTCKDENWHKIAPPYTHYKLHMDDWGCIMFQCFDDMKERKLLLTKKGRLRGGFQLSYCINRAEAQKMTCKLRLRQPVIFQLCCKKVEFGNANRRWNDLCTVCGLQEEMS